MLNYSRRFFYSSSNGEIFFETTFKGIRSIEDDIQTFLPLKERDATSYDALDINIDDYKQDFDECSDYKVNVTTKTLEFSYPDPNEPSVEQPYVDPLSDQISENTDYLLDMDYRLSMIELGL